MAGRRQQSACASDAALKARIEDLIDLCAARHAPCFTGFLDERQAGLSESIAGNRHVPGFLLWGGYEGAQRRVFGVFPEDLPPDGGSFPVVSISIRFRAEDRLGHRDFLGSLMGLGLKREAVGDILVEEGRCVLFCKEEIAKFVETQLMKVGKIGVRVVENDRAPLPRGQRFEPVLSTIASDRADCAVSVFTRLSREKCKGLFSAGLVTLNYETVKSTDAVIHVGDKISIQGYGKFIIDQIGPETKKGRLKLASRKYI